MATAARGRVWDAATGQPRRTVGSAEPVTAASLSPGGREVAYGTDHGTLEIVDLHADTLLWGRDLLVRAGHSHVDVPRLIDGGIAIEGLAVSTKVPRRANMDRNDDRTDDVTLLAIAQRWPPSTLRSLLARALYHADRARSMAIGRTRFTLIDSRSGLDAYRARRTTDRSITAAFLAIEGAHALETTRRTSIGSSRPASGCCRRPTSSTTFGVPRTASPSALRPPRAGSSPMEAGAMIVDVAHASEATIDDVLAVATGRSSPAHRRPGKPRRDAHRPTPASAVSPPAAVWSDRLLADGDRRRRPGVDRPLDPGGGRSGRCRSCRSRVGLRWWRAGPVRRDRNRSDHRPAPR